MIVKIDIVAYCQTYDVAPPEIAASPAGGSVLFLSEPSLPIWREGNFTREIPRCSEEARSLAFEVGSSSDPSNGADLIIG